MHVRRKRIRLASGEFLEDDPKTEAGGRTVALPAPLVGELQRHLLTFVGEHADTGPDAYVFTSSDGLPIDRNNFRTRIWVQATRGAGVTGLRFHDLRHTAGTLAAQTGASTKELMARLGHASMRASIIYQHAAEERDRLIAQRLGDVAEDVVRRQRETSEALDWTGCCCSEKCSANVYGRQRTSTDAQS